MATKLNDAKENNRKVLDSVVIRFAGDSGDGMQLAGTQFTQSTALNPDCDAPDAKATVLPHSPKVKVLPDSVVTVFTFILLVIIYLILKLISY